VRLTRDVGAITMDVNDTETIDLNALGGTDTITVNDLTGTDVSKVNIDLGQSAGGPDGQADTVVLNATNGDDVITVTNNNGVVTVTGLAEDVTITNFDANDRIVINGLGGDDVIEASGLAGMQLTANGGDGDDVLIGGPGQDILDGGPGNNILLQAVVSTPTGAPGGGTNASAFPLLGQFMASTFVRLGDGQGQTPIADLPQSQPTFLAHPQA
jgi:Ca2+-binding RTX toxin-like protein